MVRPPSIWTIAASLLAAALICSRAQAPKVWGDQYRFSSSETIYIHDDDVAAPYPSTIVVSGVSGIVSKVTVTLRGFRHGCASDVEVLLAGPAGQRVVLMAGNGGCGNVSGLTLSFAVDGELLPNDFATLLASGTYRPTTNASQEFDGPAPDVPYLDSMRDFESANPNGVWRLFVVDRYEEDAGAIVDGWEITVNTIFPGLPECEPAAHWTPRTSTNGVTYRAVAYGNGRFATFGDNNFSGSYSISTNGVSWTNTNFGAFKSATFANGEFFALSDFGVWRTSFFTNWSGSLSLLVTGGLSGICVDNAGLMVVVATNGLTFFGTNNFSWRTNNTGTTNRFRSVTTGSNRFVAVGSTGIVFVCTNRTNWQAAASETRTNLNAIVFGNGRFVAVGDGGVIIHSPNGRDWIPAESRTSARLAAISYIQGRFIALGETSSNSVLLVSPTGWTWKAHDIGPPLLWGGIAASSNSLVAVGSKGTIWQSFATPTITSPPSNRTICARDSAAFSAIVDCACPLVFDWRRNGVSIPYAKSSNLFLPDVYPWDAGNYTVTAWSGTNAITSAPAKLQVNLCSPLDRFAVTNGPSTNSMRSVVCSDSGLVAVGANGALWRSTNGAAWSVSSLGTNAGFTGVTQGDGRIVAVGSNGITAASIDGRNWTIGFCGVNRTLNSVAYGNSKFVAVTDGAYVSVSTNGVAWTLVPSLTTNRFLLAVAWGAGTFVIVGNNGRILTSPDGFNWTFWPSGTDATLNTVAYGNGTFVAAGSPGNILRSRDGFIWYAASNPVSTRIDKVVYAGSRFVGVAGAEGFISSSDAVTWSVHPAPIGSALRDLAFCGHAVTAVGQNGVVAATAFFGPPILSIDRSSRLQLRGEMWGVYHLQRAKNVAAGEWTDALAVTNLVGSIPLTDPSPGLAPRFYRAVSP